MSKVKGSKPSRLPENENELVQRKPKSISTGQDAKLDNEPKLPIHYDGPSAEPCPYKRGDRVITPDGKIRVVNSVDVRVHVEVGATCSHYRPSDLKPAEPQHRDVLGVSCLSCNAEPGTPCKDPAGAGRTCLKRTIAAYKSREYLQLAAPNLEKTTTNLSKCLHATPCESWEACAHRMGRDADDRVREAYRASCKVILDYDKTIEACARVVEGLQWPEESLDADRELLDSGFATAAQAIRFLSSGSEPETRERLLQSADQKCPFGCGWSIHNHAQCPPKKLDSVEIYKAALEEICKKTSCSETKRRALQALNGPIPGPPPIPWVPGVTGKKPTNG